MQSIQRKVLFSTSLLLITFGLLCFTISFIFSMAPTVHDTYAGYHRVDLTSLKEGQHIEIDFPSNIVVIVKRSEQQVEQLKKRELSKTDSEWMAIDPPTSRNALRSIKNDYFVFSVPKMRLIWRDLDGKIEAERTDYLPSHVYSHDPMPVMAFFNDSRKSNNKTVLGGIMFPFVEVSWPDMEVVEKPPYASDYPAILYDLAGWPLSDFGPWQRDPLAIPPHFYDEAGDLMLGRPVSDIPGYVMTKKLLSWVK